GGEGGGEDGFVVLPAGDPDRRLVLGLVEHLGLYQAGRVQFRVAAEGDGHRGRQAGPPARRRGRGLTGRVEQHHAGHVVVGPVEQDGVAGVHAQPPGALPVGGGQDDVVLAVAADPGGGYRRQQGYAGAGGRQLAGAQAAVGGRGGAAGAAGTAGDEPSRAVELHGGAHAVQDPAPPADLGADHVDGDRLTGLREPQPG